MAGCSQNVGVRPTRTQQQHRRVVEDGILEKLERSEHACRKMRTALVESSDEACGCERTSRSDDHEGPSAQSLDDLCQARDVKNLSRCVGLSERGQL